PTGALRAPDDDGGPVVAAHRVNGDLHPLTGSSRARPLVGATPLRGFDGEDLAGPGVPAVRADAVGQLALPALRTHRTRRRGELVVRAALAAARPGVAWVAQGGRG